MSRSCVPVLTKGNYTIAFALRLAAKHLRDAESVIITLIEHSIEIACTFGYEVRLELTTGSTFQGKAITTETSKDKKEYLLFNDFPHAQKVELTNIKSMTAVQPNPHFDCITF